MLDRLITSLSFFNVVFAEDHIFEELLNKNTRGITKVNFHEDFKIVLDYLTIPVIKVNNNIESSALKESLKSSPSLIFG